MPSYENVNLSQGPIVNFNLLRDDGTFIGFVEVFGTEDSEIKTYFIFWLNEWPIYSASNCERVAIVI
jgi:hypothetical protein